MDNISKGKSQDLFINIDKITKKEEGEFSDKNVTSPRSPKKKNIYKENLENNNITDITNREISSQEEEQKETRKLDSIVNDIKNSKDISTNELYEVLWHASYLKELLDEKDLTQALIDHFKQDKSRLTEQDAQGNTAFHWAAKLNSFTAWETFRNLLGNEEAPLSLENHFGQTATDFIFESPDPDFVKSVLLDELKRNQNSPFINDLINQYGSDIKSYTTYADNEDFIDHYIQHRALLSGNKATIDKVITESYRQWERAQKETGTSVASFTKSSDLTDIVECYSNYNRDQLQQAGYTREILEKALADNEYKIENNDILSDFIQYMRKQYADWQSITKTYPIEGFMRTPVYLSIASVILAGGNLKAINALNNRSELYTLKHLLEDKNTDQKSVESCIINLFKQKDGHRIFEDLGYQPKEVIQLAEKHAFAIASSGTLSNMLSLLADKYFYNLDHIEKFLSSRNTEGSTLLNYSAQHGHLGADLVTLHKIGCSDETITKLLSVKDRYGDMPLLYSASCGHLGADLVTLKKGGLSDETITKFLSIQNKNGETPLHIAAMNGHLGAVLVALHKIGCSDETITKLLSITDKYGNTPLNVVAEGGDLGADLVALNKGGFSDETIETFLSIPSEDGKMPLHIVARYGYLGASLAKLDKIGFSKTQIIKFLSITDKDGKTPLFGNENDKELTRALQSAGLEESDIKPLYLQLK